MTKTAECGKGVDKRGEVLGLLSIVSERSGGLERAPIISHSSLWSVYLSNALQNSGSLRNGVLELLGLLW
jgi:hypothetical protein